jgi:hypothetical protein
LCLKQTAHIPWLASTLSALVPDWQHFWVCDALNAGGRIPWRYVMQAGVYGLLYLVGVICIGLFSFKNVEMK